MFHTDSGSLYLSETGTVSQTRFLQPRPYRTFVWCQWVPSVSTIIVFWFSVSVLSKKHVVRRHLEVDPLPCCSSLCSAILFIILLCSCHSKPLPPFCLPPPTPPIHTHTHTHTHTPHSSLLNPPFLTSISFKYLQQFSQQAFPKHSLANSPGGARWIVAAPRCISAPLLLNRMLQMLMRAPKCQHTEEIGLLNRQSLMNNSVCGYDTLWDHWQKVKGEEKVKK